MRVPYRVVLCLGCHAEWQVPAASPSPGYDYDLIDCKCPIGSEPEFIWADEYVGVSELKA